MGGCLGFISALPRRGIQQDHVARVARGAMKSGTISVAG